jgi:hypothetical protein
MNQTELVKKLIINNLRSTKLVDGLITHLNLYAGEYYNQHHVEIVFDLMQIERTEENSSQYQMLCEQVSEINIEHFESLENLADRIHDYLNSLKNEK